MDRPSQLVLIRHGQSLRNEAIKHQVYFPDLESMAPVKGIPDHEIPLTEFGMSQAQQTGEGMIKLFGLPDYVYHSGYKRTIQTMEGVLDVWGKDMQKKVRIRMNPFIYERRPGYTYDMTKTEVDRNFPWFEAHYAMLGGYFAQPPGGESMAEVVGRVYNFINMLFRDRAGQKVWVVLHGGTLKAMRFILERWSFEQGARWPEGQSPKNCSITCYEYDATEKRLDLQGHNVVLWK